MSKLVLFTAAVDGKLWWLALAGMLNSAFSMAYYGWVVKRMYFDEPTSPGKLKEPTTLMVVLVACTVIVVVVGIYPGPILHYLFQVANQLLPAGASLGT